MVVVMVKSNAAELFSVFVFGVAQAVGHAAVNTRLVAPPDCPAHPANTTYHQAVARAVHGLQAEFLALSGLENEHVLEIVLVVPWRGREGGSSESVRRV